MMQLEMQLLRLPLLKITLIPRLMLLIYRYYQIILNLLEFMMLELNLLQLLAEKYMRQLFTRLIIILHLIWKFQALV